MSNIWTTVPDATIQSGFALAVDDNETIALALDDDETIALELGEQFTCPVQ